MAYTIGFAATLSPRVRDLGAEYDAEERSSTLVRRALSDADMCDAIEHLVGLGAISSELAEKIEEEALRFTEIRLSKVRA